jgi:hypothetical protein
MHSARRDWIPLPIRSNCSGECSAQNGFRKQSNFQAVVSIIDKRIEAKKITVNKNVIFKIMKFSTLNLDNF